MNNDKDDNSGTSWSAVIKDYFDRELHSRRIAESKKAFIEIHFSKPVGLLGLGQWVFRPLALVVFLMGFAFLSHYVWNHGLEVGYNAFNRKIRNVWGERNSGNQGLQDTVQVKRLTSSVGPTLLFQRMVGDTPMTVIWVFPKGETL